MTRAVYVTGYPRIHVTLIDMAGVTSTAPGGAGFSIDAHPTVVKAEYGATFSLDGPAHLDSESWVDLEHLCRRLEEITDGRAARVTIESSPRQHVGLGAKTSLLLSVITAVDRLLRLSLSQNEIQELSRRGGTSGIGIHSFFTGGFVVDAGQRRESGWAPTPSRNIPDPILPLKILNFSVDESWVIILLTPEARTVSGNLEIDFFSKNCPIPSHEVLEVLSHVYHGLVPSMLKSDLAGLRESLNLINQSGFKKREIDNYRGIIRGLLLDLYESKVPSGMSSLGPTVFAIVHKDDHETINRIRVIAHDRCVFFDGPFNARNEGAKVLERCR